MLLYCCDVNKIRRRNSTKNKIDDIPISLLTENQEWLHIITSKHELIRLVWIVIEVNDKDLGVPSIFEFYWHRNFLNRSCMDYGLGILNMAALF